MTEQDNLSRALQLLAASRLDEARIYLEELRALARNGLREIAVRELKARGPRMDAVFYLIRLLPSRSSVETTILIMPHHLPHRWIPLNRL